MVKEACPSLVGAVIGPSLVLMIGSGACRLLPSLGWVITESLLQYFLWLVYFGQSLLIGLFIVDATVGWRMRQ